MAIGFWGTTGLVIVLLLGTVYQVLKDPRHKQSIGSLSPRFDGRDTDSEGDYFQNRLGLWIYYRNWVPSKIKGSVVLSHGYAEHIGRYETLAKELNEAGIAVFGMDHQGHGRSEGERCYVENFSDYVHDVATFIKNIVLVTDGAKGKPLFILGHSMGALIALETVASSPKNFFKGLVLSSPALKIADDIAQPHLLAIAEFLSRHVPKLPIFGSRISDPSRISHRPEIAQNYAEDPLIYHGSFIARQSWEVLKSIGRVNETLSKITLPVCGIHGLEDRLTPVEGMKNAEALIKSSDKTIKYFPAPFQHELLHESDIRKEVIAWVVAHTK